MSMSGKLNERAITIEQREALRSSYSPPTAREPDARAELVAGGAARCVRTDLRDYRHPACPA